ncbi:MAG: 4Fe-4S binding protein [Candidatus Heimdallarchaeota archaeon]|nr:4Fe-4S binding protein [Candidatus Heimdallarchaeota archaeon]
MVKQITIISGKGGTGKTTFTAAIASLSEGRAVFADADVDAPDLHLILRPQIFSQEDLINSKKVIRDETKCTKCNICEEMCQFEAITATEYYYYKCEGCLLCIRTCPELALELQMNKSATIYQAKTRFGPFAYAEMSIGEGNSGRIVDTVRKISREIAEKEQKELIIIDGSPGIGCPVIASITGIDLAIIIVEPTLSGIHDLERVVGITDHFKVKSVVCVNKYDINENNTQAIEDYCEKRNIELIGKIPFDPIVPQSIMKSLSVTEMPENAVAKEIKNVWKKIKEILAI